MFLEINWFKCKFVYIMPYLYHLRTIFKYVIELAYIVNVSVDLIQGIKDMWNCLRIQTPRPLCPDKFYNMCQRVKSLYEAELPWMEDDQSPTLHKVWDHPREVLARLPDTLRLAMLEEGPLEGVKFSVSIVVSEGYGASKSCAQNYINFINKVGTPSQRTFLNLVDVY